MPRVVRIGNRPLPGAPPTGFGLLDEASDQSINPPVLVYLLDADGTFLMTEVND